MRKVLLNLPDLFHIHYAIMLTRGGYLGRFLYTWISYSTIAYHNLMITSFPILQPDGVWLTPTIISTLNCSYPQWSSSIFRYESLSDSAFAWLSNGGLYRSHPWYDKYKQRPALSI